MPGINIKVDLTNWIADLNKTVKEKQKIFDEAFNLVADKLKAKIEDLTPVGDPSLWKWPAHKDYEPGTLKASWVKENDGPTTIIISNQTPYAYRVEYGSWSTQAPNGMMRIGCMNFENLMAETAKELGL